MPRYAIALLPMSLLPWKISAIKYPRCEGASTDVEQRVALSDRVIVGKKFELPLNATAEDVIPDVKTLTDCVDLGRNNNTLPWDGMAWRYDQDDKSCSIYRNVTLGLDLNNMSKSSVYLGITSSYSCGGAMGFAYMAADAEGADPRLKSALNDMQCCEIWYEGKRRD